MTLPAFVANSVIAELKNPPTISSLMAKHGMTAEELQAELVIGVKTAREHTDDNFAAEVIALQQLEEDGHYYTKGTFRNAASWPRSFSARHLEPGPVKYEGMGEIDPKTGRRKDLTLLLRKEAIDKMRNTAKGKPVVNWQHQDVDSKDFKNGKADGIITGSRWNGDDGWDWMDILVWDEDTKRNCENGFQVSCAYKPTELDMTPGIYHNIAYDGEILNGTYEHLAILSNPRYEQSMIICNSIGGKMNKLWLKLKNAVTGNSDTVELDGATEVELDGTKIPLSSLVDAFKAEQAEKANATLLNSAKEFKDDTLVTVDGVEVSVKDLKASYAARTLKNAADAQAQVEVEAADKVKKEQEEAAVIKNAADAKEAEEKAILEAETLKNAKEASDKAEAEKTVKEAAEKAESERQFLNLKNAATKGGKPVELPAYQSQADRLAKGHEMFGAEPAAK